MQTGSIIKLNRYPITPVITPKSRLNTISATVATLIIAPVLVAATSVG